MREALITMPLPPHIILINVNPVYRIAWFASVGCGVLINLETNLTSIDSLNKFLICHHFTDSICQVCRKIYQLTISYCNRTITKSALTIDVQCVDTMHPCTLVTILLEQETKWYILEILWNFEIKMYVVTLVKFACNSHNVITSRSYYVDRNFENTILYHVR